MYQGSGHIMNYYNKKVIDVDGGKDEEGRKVHVWKRHNGANQKWHILYVDRKKKDTTTHNMGFRVNTPFYLVSRLPHKRVMECIGASNVTIKKFYRNRTAQQWYFDQKSKTIKSNYWKSYSMNIQSNGRSNNLGMTTTNSRWW
jgi:hypothetical protein